MTTLIEDIREYGEMKYRAGFYAGIIVGLTISIIFILSTSGNPFHFQTASLEAQQ
jgi:hypothetical protein